MTRRLVFGVLALLGVTLLTAGIAVGQGGTGTTMLWIDSPIGGATIVNGTPVDIGGWAVDPMSPGTGVDLVQVYLDAPMDAGGPLLGTASYGGSRPDVAGVLGNAAFATAGYDEQWTPTGLSVGPHLLYVYGHAVAGDWSYKTVSVTVLAQPTPAPVPSTGGYNAPYGGSAPGPNSPGPSSMGPYPMSPYPMSPYQGPRPMR